MASNKHVDFRQIENFVRNKCYPEDTLKDKEKKTNFRKSCENFKMVDVHLTCKGKRRVILDNNKKRTD